jgi:hypothetical protein
MSKWNSDEWIRSSDEQSSDEQIMSGADDVE